MSNRYEVVNLPVHGVTKGGVVEIEDGAQARRLVRAGHIKPLPAKKTTSKKDAGEPDETEKEN